MNCHFFINIRKLITRLIFMFFCLIYPVFVRTAEPVVIKKAEKPPVIDGKLDEPIWKTATVFTNFKTYKPDSGLEPSEKTEVYVTYDQSNIYFAVRCFDSDPKKIKASMAKRDNIERDDWISIELDTYNNAQSNFFFRVNPLGIQSDGTINLEGEDDLTLDMLWSSRAQQNEKGYFVEIGIPFKSLRFSFNEKIIIGMGVRRSISRKSEIVVFPEFDPKAGSLLLQRQAVIISGIKYDRTIEILPALTFGRGSSHISGEWDQDTPLNDFSLTGKLGITSDLTLDVTYNPDFSQVESDAGQIDINQRSALFYPEKRPFFFEGKENFNFATDLYRFWTPIITFINTRNIVDPVFGIKLNGKIGSKNMISGIFTLDEYPKKIAEDNGNDDGKNAAYSIFRYKRELKDDSYVGLIYTGKEHFDNFNRVIGLDGRIRINGKNRIEYHGFLSSNNFDTESNSSQNGSSIGIQYHYSSRKFNTYIGFHDISKNFHTEVGQIRRKGITYIPTYSFYNIYLKSGLLKKIKIEYYGQYSIDKFSNRFENSFNWLGFCWFMPRQTWGWLGGCVRDEIFAGQKFRKDYYGAGIYSQLFKQLYLEFVYEAGKEIDYDAVIPYQGNRTLFSSGLVFQPTGKITFELNYTDYKFYRDLDSQKIYDYKIIRSQNTFQLNKYLFFRGILEYNSYNKKLNADFLASFTYIPGTVIQLGYGSIYEKLRWNEREYIPATNFLQTKKSFFFKASYLWRF